MRELANVSTIVTVQIAKKILTPIMPIQQPTEVVDHHWSGLYRQRIIAKYNSTYCLIVLRNPTVSSAHSSIWTSLPSYHGTYPYLKTNKTASATGRN
jgi:hypothetical protein